VDGSSITRRRATGSENRKTAPVFSNRDAAREISDLPESVPRYTNSGSNDVIFHIPVHWIEEPGNMHEKYTEYGYYPEPVKIISPCWFASLDF